MYVYLHQSSFPVNQDQDVTLTAPCRFINYSETNISNGVRVNDFPALKTEQEVRRLERHLIPK